MLEKLKTVTALSTIVNYLENTSITRKLLDFSFSFIILTLIGVITGKVPLAEVLRVISPVYWAVLVCITVFLYLLSAKIIRITVPKKHDSVERSFSQSQHITRILSGEQYMSGYDVLARVQFHNGVHSLDNSFGFIKMSLTEYASAQHIIVDATNFQNLPVVINFDLISSLVNKKMYCTSVTTASALYESFLNMGIKKYCAMGIRNSNDILTGFVFVGVNGGELPTEENMKRIVEAIK